jgi:hypothetical protein
LRFQQKKLAKRTDVVKHNIVYLACPYSHADMAVRIERFEASAHAAAELIRRGMFVYSPITMTHPIDLVLAEEGGSMGSDYWCDFDEAFMEVCSEMIILKIPGWQESRGIKREKDFFEQKGKRVSFMALGTDGEYQLGERQK